MEIIYHTVSPMGSTWFTFPQKEGYSIFLFGHRHDSSWSNTFPFNGDIVSFQMNTGTYLKVGRFLITEDKRYLVLALDQLGFIYGIRNNNDDYVLIEEVPKELQNDQMKILEKEFLLKKMNIATELYHHVLM